MHGLMDGEAVLGPVPKPWAIKIVSDATKGEIWTCYDDKKSLAAPEDVRLVAVWMEYSAIQRARW